MAGFSSENLTRFLLGRSCWVSSTKAMLAVQGSGFQCSAKCLCWWRQRLVQVVPETKGIVLGNAKGDVVIRTGVPRALSSANGVEARLL